MARKSTKDFIDESNIVHNYKYENTLVNYVNSLSYGINPNDELRSLVIGNKISNEINVKASTE